VPPNRRLVADPPDGIVLRRHRDLVGRTWHPWVRRGVLALLGVILLLALLNVFGQRPATAITDAPSARLEVSSPSSVRGGLMFQARFTIRARRDLKDATLVLGDGWLENMTVNTIEPSPVGEASDDGKLSLELGHIPARRKYVLFVQFQVNPTNVGHREQTVALRDGDRQLLTYDKTITVFP
jgi:hypothetical protein